MSDKSIYGANFKFNKLNLNEIYFSDGSAQTTAYTGSTPQPTTINYNILTSTPLLCSNNINCNLQEEINILNVNIGYESSLYFLSSTQQNIFNFNIVFNNNFNGSFFITLLNDMQIKPNYDNNNFCYILNNNTGVISYGNITLNTNGDLIIYFNSIIINTSTIYTLNINTFKFN